MLDDAPFNLVGGLAEERDSDVRLAGMKGRRDPSGEGLGSRDDTDPQVPCEPAARSPDCLLEGGDVGQHAPSNIEHLLTLRSQTFKTLVGAEHQRHPELLLELTQRGR